MSARPADSWTDWARAVPALGPTSILEAPGDPLEAAAALAEGVLAGEDYAVYEHDGVWYFATGAAVTLTADATTLTARADGRSWARATGGSPLEDVASALAALRAELGENRNVYGWAAFELAHLLHGDPAAAGNERLAHILVPATEITLLPGKAEIRSTDTTRTDHFTAVLRNALMSESVPSENLSGAVVDTAHLVDMDSPGYRRAVSGGVADIRAGLIEKAVISRTVRLPEQPPLDLPATYSAVRRANTPARSFLLDLGGQRAAGVSPETVVEVDREGRVSTQPLAGTRAFGPDSEHNDRLREELLADPKEVHEHAVSVRLALEEMASFCEPGSVAVTEFMNIRERGSVQHLASRVVGRLAGTANPWTAFAALFPAITATGVPKAGALAALKRYEPEARGLYGGAVFRAGTDGSLDAALVLRTVFVQGSRAWLRAGAGVMGGSHPEREFEETCEKLRSVAPFLRFEEERAVVRPQRSAEVRADAVG